MMSASGSQGRSDLLEQRRSGALVIGHPTFLRGHVTRALQQGLYATQCWAPGDSSTPREQGPSIGAIWCIFEPAGPQQWLEGLGVLTEVVSDAAGRFATDCIVVVVCAVRESLASPGERLALEQALNHVRHAADERGQRLVTLRVGAALGEAALPEQGLGCSLVPLLARWLPAVASGDDLSAAGETRVLRVLSASELTRRLSEVSADLRVAPGCSDIHGHAGVRLDHLVVVSRSLLESTLTPVVLTGGGEPASLAHALQQLTCEQVESPEPTEGEVVIDDIANVVATYLRHASGDAARSFFREVQCTALDGVPLRAYHQWASGDPVVFVNAYGVSADITVPLARELAEVNWYTLESRYVPVLARDYDPRRTDVGQHADDVLAFLDAQGLAAVHLAGWCTGAQVALKFAHDHPGRVRSLTLVNGAFALASLRQVEFHQSITGLLERAASSVASAAVLQRMMYSTSALECAQAAVDESDTGLVGQKNPHLAQMLAQIFVTPESMNRYARMGVRLWEEPGHAWTTSVRVPTLVLTGSVDRMSPPHTSTEIANLLERATLVSIDEGDHYMLYLQPARVAAEMRAFLRTERATLRPALATQWGAEP